MTEAIVYDEAKILNLAIKYTERTVTDTLDQMDRIMTTPLSGFTRQIAESTAQAAVAQLAYVLITKDIVHHDRWLQLIGYSQPS